MKISCDYSHVILLQKFNYNRKNELSLQDQFSIFPAYEDHGLETGSSPDVVAKVVLKAVTRKAKSEVFSWQGYRNSDRN